MKRLSPAGVVRPYKLYKNLKNSSILLPGGSFYPGESDEAPCDVSVCNSFFCERFGEKFFWREIRSVETHNCLANAICHDAPGVVVFGARGPGTNQRTNPAQ